MITFDLEETIQRPVEAVWSFLDNTRNGTQWQPATIDQRYTSPEPHGLGDKAIFDTQEDVLHVLKGNLYLYVSLVKLSEQGASKVLPEARHIATAILANA